MNVMGVTNHFLIGFLPNFRKRKSRPDVVIMYVFNPSTWEAKADGSFYDFKANLDYIISSRPVRGT